MLWRRATALGARRPAANEVTVPRRRYQRWHYPRQHYPRRPHHFASVHPLSEKRGHFCLLNGETVSFFRPPGQPSILFSPAKLTRWAIRPSGSIIAAGRRFARRPAGGFSFRCAERAQGGDVAQLVERLLCKQDVRSSNLLVSKAFFGGMPLSCSYLPTAGTRKKIQRRRRPKGPGAAYFVVARNLWTCVAELQKGANGKRRRRIVYGKTRAEAERKLSGSLLI